MTLSALSRGHPLRHPHFARDLSRGLLISLKPHDPRARSEVGSDGAFGVLAWRVRPPVLDGIRRETRLGYAQPASQGTRRDEKNTSTGTGTVPA
jgi:hypothetical protein